MKSLMIEKKINDFCNSIDMDFQIDFVKEYEQIGDSPIFGGKHCGSKAEQEGAHYIAGKLKEIGVPSVEMLPFKTCKYQFNGAKIDLSNGLKKKDGRVIEAYGYASPGTDANGITAELIDMGTSYKENYSDIDAKGKIVVIKGMDGLEGENVTEQLEEAQLHGAAGILIYMVDDILDDEMIRVQYPRFIATIPVLAISKSDGEYLKVLIRNNPGMEMTMTVDADYEPEGGTSYNVLGIIPGSVSEEQIVFTAHLDHYFKCLQDNMSSCATVLGIAKAMIDSGYKPNRTICFVFHASHECGLADSKFNYIFGAYKMAHEIHPEWRGKTIAQINFEYTALKLKTLSAVSGLGCNRNILNYREYAPPLVGGFEEINCEKVPEYMVAMVTYCDLIGYITAGIPGYTNDVMSEQLNENPTSPYCGRDHSTRDNWEIFDMKALEDTARYYGGFGIYLDQLPYLVMDYSCYDERIRYALDDEAIKELENAGVKMQPYMEALASLVDSGSRLYEKLVSANNDYLKNIGEDEDLNYIKESFAEASALNREVLGMFDYLQKNLEKITTLGLMYLGSQKYMENIVMISEAIEHLKKGNIGKALSEALIYVDLLGKSICFSEELVEHRRKQSMDTEYADSRTWAKGRELKTCLTMYRLVQNLKDKKQQGKTKCTKEILQLNLAMLKELVELKRILKEETKVFNYISERSNML